MILLQFLWLFYFSENDCPVRRTIRCRSQIVTEQRHKQKSSGALGTGTFFGSLGSQGSACQPPEILLN